MTRKQTQTASTDAATFTFGIEIETLVPHAIYRTMPINGWHTHYTTKIGTAASFPCADWTAHRDSSLSTELSTHTPIEFVSPVLQGSDGIAQILAVASWLDGIGARTNTKCGTHIHVGYKSVIGSTCENDVASWVANLINVTAQFELAINGAAGSYRRSHGHWARSIKTDSHRNASAAIKGARKNCKGAALRNASASTDRYRLLNLSNIAGSRLPTVEFRSFSGTIDGLKMAAWVQMCLALCERAAGRNVRFDAPTTTAYRGNGAAKKSLDRFFYLMGWTLGRKDDKAPSVEASGFVADIATMKAVKKELRRLAKKFDTEAAAAS